MSKVNVFISHDPSDRAEVEALLEWLFPMTDEVNIWCNVPPSDLPVMPLPWRILFFWHRPHNYLREYYRVNDQRRRRAHLYIFLASEKAIESTEVQADIALANERKTAGDWRSPRLFRLEAKKCNWKKYKDWSGLAALGDEVPLRQASRKNWITLTEAIDYHVKFVEPILRETRFYQGRPVVEDVHNPNGLDDIPLPDLNDDPAAVTFEAPTASYPPAWAGWALIAILLLVGGRSLTSERERIGADLHLKARPASERPIEYPRENRYVPPEDTAIVWPK
jgi:hypothetical protein